MSRLLRTLRKLLFAVFAIGVSFATPHTSFADAELKEVARIKVGSEPIGIDVASDGNVVVVSAAGRGVHVLDPRNYSELRRLDLSAHGRLSRVFVSKETGEVFVSASVNGEVLKLTPSASSVVSSLSTGGFPQGIAEKDGRLFVALTAGQAVSVIDRDEMVLLRTLDAGDRPSSIHIDHKADRIYVIKSTTRSIWVFDAKTLTWTHNIADQSFIRLSDLAQAPDGRLLLLDSAQDTLLIIDASTNTVVAHVPLLKDDCQQCRHVPMALAISPDGRSAAVVGRGGWVSLVDLSSQSLVDARMSGQDYRGVAWSGNDRIFATSFGSGEVVVLERRIP